jgi:aminoglycoside phosphotransferase (APT) family kinase protein
MTHTSTRHDIYYWKCDRAAAFHGTAQGAARSRPEIESAARAVVARHFGEEPSGFELGVGQGNHLTFVASVAGRRYFVRIEDGPEQDNYVAVEACVMAKVRALGVPTPEIFAADASRREVPFAWQIMELVAEPDLNRHFKAGTLETPEIAEQIGCYVAMWQNVRVEGFGFFDPELAQSKATLQGTQANYAAYFHTRLEAHLGFLVEREFLTAERVAEIQSVIERHRSLLALPEACLVHKDLALWNVLGTERKVTAVIDWDDCIGGDPMDDLSLLACFHDGAFLRQAFAGYAGVRALPRDYVPRFWLHLLRNMIFKAVIRVGAGYFNHGSNFFLVGAGGSGETLREQTLARIAAAVDGLREQRDPLSL